MHVIAWSIEFPLGIGEIDEQHKALAGMINALDAGTRGDFAADSMRELLAELNVYVKNHFAFEELLMAGGGCSQELVTRHLG